MPVGNPNTTMASARSPRDGRTRHRGTADEDESMATKVVLMELVEAARPLSAAELQDRTLLSETAVTSALATLCDRGLCRERPGDERRPTRFDPIEPDATNR